MSRDPRRFAGGHGEGSRSSGIRNVCLAGHVDHGKSSYADSLLAANNIISSRLAGKIRYLDSRQDEQERGITMESSAVSLSYRALRKTPEGSVAQDYMINLIDTPGHVDFSSEVDTASRLCDGVLIVVDAVEGVCTQTVNVLRQAWTERLRPLLVINKLDRLIVELKFAPIEAHHHLVQLVEQVNAVMGSFFASERLEDDLRWREDREKRIAEQLERRANDVAAAGPSAPPLDGDNDVDADTETAFVERDDEDLYFAPENGNVLFASAIDGWAFRLTHFARLHAVRLGLREARLTKVLWGDFYLDPKSKRVVTRKGLGKRTLKPLFVQLVLENIWAVYESVVISPCVRLASVPRWPVRTSWELTMCPHSNPDKITKIVSALGVKIRPQDLRSKDTKNLLTAIFSQWLPLASATFRAIVEQVPAPSDAQRARLHRMLHPDASATQTTPEPSNDVERDLYTANAEPSATAVAYVSKNFAVPSRDLPHNQRRQLTADEMRERGRILRASGSTAAEHVTPSQPLEDGQRTPTDAADEHVADLDGETLIGFARLFSGTLRVGQPVYCVMPKYTTTLPPSHQSNVNHLLTTNITALYMLMGRELVAVDEVPAGNVFGVCGLEGRVLRNATLCAPASSTPQSSLALPPIDAACLVNLAGFRLVTAPIVRVALEPADPAQLPILVEGLRLLSQADPCAETLVQETGEHVILTAGELHLERCLRDLRDRFAKIEIQVSPPIVPARESAVDAADMAPPKTTGSPRGTVHVTLLSGLVQVTVRAVPLPEEVANFLTANAPTIKRLFIERKAGPELDTAAEFDAAALVEHAEAEMSADDFWSSLAQLFESAGPAWSTAVDNVWSFGPRRVGPNVLIDALSSVPRSLRQKSASRDFKGVERLAADTRAFDESIETAFQLATLRGPLCAEPMTGMAFMVEKLDVQSDPEQVQSRLSQLTGGLISSVQDAFRTGLLDWSPRILLAMYTCDIQATTEVLGKVYGVVAKRRGRIVSEEMKEGTSFFTIRAMLPVVESFGFADDIRTRTSGAASPQLVFSGFERLEQDPFWVPTTEEELEDLGEKADRENVAKKYVDAIRKRKGMAVERKIVEHADKQRTLKRA